MRPTDNLRAAAIMIAAITAFCLNDAFMKALSARVPIGELMAVRGLFAVPLLLLVLPRVGLRLGRPDRWAVLRGVGELGVSFAFLTALRFLPLGDTYTLYFAAPIMLTATAALFMGERVGPRRWAAVLVGFSGVLVVMGLPTQWQFASILALGAAALSVGRDVCTRKVSPEVGSGTVAVATGVIVALGGAATALAGDWVALTWREVAFCLLAALGAAGGYVGFVAALRMGDLSFIATFRYAGIPVAMLLGLLVWGDVPGPQMLAGAVLIVGSGLYILLRERRLSRVKPAHGAAVAKPPG